MKTNIDIDKQNELFQKETLSYLLNDTKLYMEVFDMVRPELFSGMYRQIFTVYADLISQNVKPDALNISAKTQIPVSKITGIMTHFSGSNIPLINLIFELYNVYAKKQLFILAETVAKQTETEADYESILDLISKEIKNLQLGTSANIITMPEAIQRLMQTVTDNRKAEHKFSGTPTGLKIIDYHMGGFHPGDLVILAGETSHCKTSFALNCMYRSAVLYDQPVGIISHEMTPEQLTGRLCSYTTEIAAKHLLFGKLTDDEMVVFNQKINLLIRSKIFIQDYIKRELLVSIAAIRLMVIQHQVRYVVVENAGNISVKGIFDDEPRTAEISKSMKAIAMELGITVILISHLNREALGKKSQPTLSRLRHSGQLENDADVVLFIYRAELHGKDTFDDHSDEGNISAIGMAKVYIAKGRNVGLAQTYMHFNEQLTLFSDDRPGSPF
jgi:replicative DNA helicase